MRIHEKFKKLMLQTVFVPSAFIICTIALFALLFYQLSLSTKWLEHSNYVIQEVGVVRTDFYKLQSQLRAFVITRNVNELSELLTKHNVLTILDRLEKHTVDNRDQSLRVARIKGNMQGWLDYTNQILILLKTDPKKAEELIESGLGEKISKQITESIDFLMAEEQRLRGIRKESHLLDLRLISFVLLPFILLFSILIIFQGRSNLLQLYHDYEGIIKERDKDKKNKERDVLLKTLESKVLDQLISVDTFQDQLDTLLKFFSENFQIKIATVFINEGKNHFVLKGSAGFSGNKVGINDFSENEGWIAQVLRNPKPQLLENPHKEKWKLRSSLVEIETDYIALLPLTSNNYTIAIMEMAVSGNNIDDFMDFLMFTSSKIASLLDNYLSREKLEKLFSELQSQSEELQAQQEELRTTNEELHLQATILEEQKDQLRLRNSALADSAKEIAKQKQELEKVSQYKSQFLANMSHELRTPLNSTMILAQLLKENTEGNLSKKQIEMADQIHKSGHRLLLLINDILDLSRVESGMLELKKTVFPIKNLLKNLEKTFEPIANNHNLKWEIQNKASINELYTDELRLEQILTNFLSNSFKFTKTGGVTLLVEDDLNSDGDKIIVFKVIDTGVGIPMEKQKNIFEPFRRIESAKQEPKEGSGLGLAISIQLAKLIKGVIEVDSKEDHGSTFKLVIPLEAFPATANSMITKQDNLTPPRIQPIADIPPGRKNSLILIIEDDLEFAKILREHLIQEGFHCIVTNHASEGFVLAKKHKPLAVILDNHLPDASGLSILKKIRETDEIKDIPVHLISVSDFASQAQRLGAQQYLLKPVNVQELRSLLDILKSYQGMSHRRVLIVENDPTQAMGLAEALSTCDLQSTIIHSGKEAIEFLQHENSIGCIILDYQLGDMTGLEVLKTLAKSENHRTIPQVIVYTGQQLTPQEEKELNKLSRALVLKGSRSQERLLDEINLFLHSQVEEKSKETRSKFSKNLSLANLNILLVDDDVRNIYSLTAALETKGASILTAAHGEEAIKILKSRRDIDLILMDIMMPVMDGYEATRIIRNELKLTKLPIIALTAKGMKDDRDRSLQSGANDYLTKPVDLEKLLSLIKVWCARLS